MSRVDLRLQGLGFSLLFHGALVGLAVWLWNRPPVEREAEPLVWDVSIRDSQDLPRAEPPMLDMEPAPEAAAEPVEQTLEQSQAPELSAGPPQFSSLPSVDLSGLTPVVGAGSVGAVPIPVPAASPSGLFAAPSAGTGGGRGRLTLPDFGESGGGLVPVVRIPPSYPMEARRKKLEGWVRVEMTVLEDGSVADVRVREAKPQGVFEEAAVAAVTRWKFRPATENGRPVRRRAGQTLRFELQN